MDVLELRPSTHFAFKGLIIRLILQFIRHIACCRVLHRLGSQDIHRYELCLFQRKCSCVARCVGNEISPLEPLASKFLRDWMSEIDFRNDPAAGSPTATLLRLLLPLLVKHGSTFPPTPKSSKSVDLYPTGIGSNDGRCVQMAGTKSVQTDEVRILGIPRSG